MVALGTAITTLLVSPIPTPAQAAPSDAKITVEVATLNGSGCPAGSALVIPAADNTSFKVLYKDYIVRTGDGAKPTEFRKNCQLSLRVKAPAGRTFAVAKVDYQGFANLEANVTGHASANFYFQGGSSNSWASHPFTGPLNGAWQSTDARNLDSLGFAPCDEQRNLNINSELKVSRALDADSSAVSYLAMSSTDGNVATVYHLAWKQC